MSSKATLLVENKSNFSPISVLNYEFYSEKVNLSDRLKQSEEIQCIVGQGFVPFGMAQKPELFEYADGVDTMQFLLSF